MSFIVIVLLDQIQTYAENVKKNTENSRTKKENIEIDENRMLSVIKVGIEPTK